MAREIRIQIRPESCRTCRRCLAAGACNVRAALYALAEAKGHPVICFAHIANQMGNVVNDFEKGESQGSLDAIQVISQAAEAWLSLTD